MKGPDDITKYMYFRSIMNLPRPEFVLPRPARRTSPLRTSSTKCIGLSWLFAMQISILLKLGKARTLVGILISTAYSRGTTYELFDPERQAAVRKIDRS